jgi:predicted RNA-binding Zn-ribbon protein involved in translation (DUF1610 family)
MVHTRAKKLYLKCPHCGRVDLYGGYPSDPQVSTVMCMRCGWSGMGCAFERVKKK